MRSQILRLLPSRRLYRIAILGEATAHVLLAKAAVAVLPFSALQAYITMPACSGTNASDAPRIQRVCRTVRRVALRPRLWAVCLPQALAAHWMLRRRGIPSSIRFGVQRPVEGQLAAHAWLCVDGMVVLGGEEMEGFTQIAEFPA